MKKIFFILAAFAAVACSGGAGDSYAPVAPYTLSVDRTEIKSDGKQTATFIITDAEGKVLTENDELLARIYFKNVATGERLTHRTKTFKSVEDGEYTFSATVSGDECENCVTILSSGRSDVEVFRKMVAVYRFTASWCRYCPSMTKGFDRVSDWTKSRYVELAMHAGGSEFALNGMAAQYGTYYYTYYGLPSCLYDLDVRSSDTFCDEIESIIFNRIANSPATCGIQASSSFADGKLSFQGKIKSSTGGRYDVGFAVLRNNCIPTPPANKDEQPAYEDKYNNVVVALSGNYEKMSVSAFDLKEDGESAVCSNEIPFSVPENASLEDFSIVVFALKQDGNDVKIDNIVRFPVGESVEYVYN